MAKSDETFQKMLQDIKDNTCHDAVFIGSELTDDDALQLAEAIKENQSITTFQLAQGNAHKLEQSSLSAIASAFEGHPNLRRFEIINSNVKDEACRAIGAMIASCPEIRDVNLRDNWMSDEGFMDIIDGAKSAPKLVRLITNNNPVTGTAHHNAAMLMDSERHFHNLVNTNGLGEACRLSAEENKSFLNAIIPQLETFDPESPGEPENWDIFYRHAPAIEFIAPNKPLIKQAYERFEAFLDTLPSPDTTQSNADIAFMVEQPRYRAMDNPRVMHHLDQTVAQMNAEGMRVGSDILVRRDGVPSSFLEHVFNTNQMAGIFQSSNWKDASPGELQAVLDVMPEEMRATIPNTHQLQVLNTRSQANRER